LKTTTLPISTTPSLKKTQTTRKTSKKSTIATSTLPSSLSSITDGKLNLSTTQRIQSTPITTTTIMKKESTTTTRKSFIETTTKRPKPTTVKYVTAKLTPPKRFTLKPTTIDIEKNQRERLPVVFNADVLPDTKLVVSDDSEADTLPKLEIIPFVAHDAIKTDKYESSYHQTPYDNLEKDYFAGEKEKPFRYNNKFIHHNYDESLDYVYTNPHDRIDNGPYYYETNENQFDSFSPPKEQDFLGN
jgi:hypothetical protein